MTDPAVEDSKASSSPTLAAFARGMLAVVLVYTLLAGWIFLKADETMGAESQRLASKSVLIERKLPPEEEIAPVEDPGIGVAVSDPLPGDHGREDPGHEEQIQQVHGEEEVVEDGDTLLSEHALPAVSQEGLYELQKDGSKLPVVRKADGMTVFNAFRRPFSFEGSGEKPVVAVALADVGLSGAMTGEALKWMPPEISFVFSPYMDAPDFWVSESRARGHEAWILLPVETAAYPNDDTGPHTIILESPERENRARLEWLMSRSPGVAGFVADYGGLLAKSPQDARNVFEATFTRGLGYFDNAPERNEIAVNMALGTRSAYGTVDEWIDQDTVSRDDIKPMLERLEQRALVEGSAVGVISPLPAGYKELQIWIASLPGKGIVLAPLSALAGI